MLRALVTALVLGLSSAAMALDSVEAPGKVFYKMPSGELVKRSVTLVVPSRGEGDVILRAGDHEAVAHRFWSEDKNGRVVFYICFLSNHGLEEGMAKIFRGTYLRGTNKAVYYGDIFKMAHDGHSGEELESLLLDDDHGHPDLTYIGGFGFKADVE